MIIESCCTTLEEALAAQQRGADRIELCTDLSVGGVTPPRDLIKVVVDALTIPVNVLIRPSTRDALWHCLPERLASLDPSTTSVVSGDREGRPCEIAGRSGGVWGGAPVKKLPRVACLREAIPPALDSRVESPICHARPDRASEMHDFSFSDFVYGEEEISQMVEDIEYCKTVGAAGIVVGALMPEGAIDLAAMRRLIAAARPLPVTFHRAFDVCTQDPFVALDQIVALGCTRLLTSGQAPTAWDGRGTLALLVRRAGPRLIILIGRGVNSDNLLSLAKETGAIEFHGTRIP